MYHLKLCIPSRSLTTIPLPPCSKQLVEGIGLAGPAPVFSRTNPWESLRGDATGRRSRSGYLLSRCHDPMEPREFTGGFDQFPLQPSGFWGSMWSSGE